MLKDDLYFIENAAASPGSIVAQIRINAAHRIFEGHFPGAPVTPGVIQMGWVKAVLEETLAKPVTLKEVRTCKFLEVLDPNVTQVVNIHIKYKEEQSLEVVASGEYAGVTFFKMQAIYRL